MSLNQVQLIGNVGKDPEIRYSQAGKKIVNFSIATTEKFKNRDGLKTEKTEWHKIVVFNEHLTETVSQYVRKGSKLFVQGKLTTQKWTDNNGIDRYPTEIHLTAFGCKLDLLDKPPEKSNNQTAQDNSYTPPDNGGAPDLDDEIPY